MVPYMDCCGLKVDRTLLVTRDAYRLYGKYGGFIALEDPLRWITRTQPGQTFSLPGDILYVVVDT